MMKKRLLTFLCLLVSALALCGVLSACDFFGIFGGDKQGDHSDEGITITYYLDQNSAPITGTAFDGQFTLNSIPQRAHCVFLGLFDAPSGGAKVIDEYGRNIPTIDHSMTLWAQWKMNDCMITFDAGSGTLSGDSASMVLSYGSTISFLPVPEYEGYNFIGWENDGELISSGGIVSSGKTTFNDSNYTFEEGIDVVVLTARYERKKYKLTLEFGIGYDVQIIEVEHGDSIGSIALPEMDTGTSMIIGWSTEQGRLVEFTGTFQSDVTLFAIWSDYKPFYLYTDDTNYIILKVLRGEERVLEPATRGGYDFDGWYTSPTYAGNPVDRVSYNSSITTYFARWEMAHYTINFVPNGGDAYLEPITYTIEDFVDLPSAGTRVNFTFLGWCQRVDLSDSPITYLPRGSYGDLTLFAKWKGDDKAVTLDPAGGTLSNKYATVEYGAKYSLEVPTRTGYDFAGWFTADDVRLTDDAGVSVAPWTIVEDSTTVVAHWQIKIYTVTYDSNGGSAVQAQQYEYGSPLVYPATPTKAGLQLEGWYSDADLTQPVYEGMAVISNLTLYANWLQMIAIGTAEELMAIAEDPTSNYYLTNDINLRGENWTPIANFMGILDGRNHKIYNFSLNNSSAGSKFGFFETNGGTIKNIIFEDYVCNFSVSNKTIYAGLVVGHNQGKISNVTVKNGTTTFTGSYVDSGSTNLEFGNIAGHNEGTIEWCRAENAEISGNYTSQTTQYKSYESVYVYAAVGGLVGNNDGAITNCGNNSNVTVKMNTICSAYTHAVWSADAYGYCYSYLGGIAGHQRENGTITQCYSDAKIESVMGTASGENKAAYCYVGGLVGEAYGAITNSYSTNEVVSATYTFGHVGGIVGILYGTVSECYSTANVTATTGSQYVGGAIGGNRGAVRDSYSAGNISSVSSSNTGGFCGYNYNTGTISKCFSTGNVTTSSTTDYGRFVGTNAGTVSKCYFATGVVMTVGGVVKDTDSTEGLAEAKAKTNLFSYAFLVDELYWDDGSWNVDPTGDRLPRLYWEII